MNNNQFWENYISNKLSLSSNTFSDERQNLIVKSHQETIFAYDLTTEQDIWLGLEQDLNQDLEILLMLKKIFLKNSDSFDPLSFEKTFKRAWPVSIKMYSCVFYYALHCFVKISTKNMETLLIAQTVLDCFNSFFMKFPNQSMIHAFNISAKSYQRLIKGLTSVREKILRSSKGRKTSKPTIVKDSLNSWSDMLLSVNVPSYCSVTTREINTNNPRKKLTAKNKMLNQKNIPQVKIDAKEKSTEAQISNSANDSLVKGSSFNVSDNKNEGTKITPNSFKKFVSPILSS